MDKRTLIYLFLLAVSFYLVQLFFPSKPANLKIAQTTEKENVSSGRKSFFKTVPQETGKEENFYVLENQDQQLVFSDLGGALAEINLPLKSKENPQSPVRPIKFDRQILEDSKENSYFPLKGYYKAGFEKQKEGQKGGYYPLLRRSILNQDGSYKVKIDPVYYALNILKENDENFGRQKYKVTRFEKDLIEFVLNTKNAKITKTYTFSTLPNKDLSNHLPYMLELKITLDSPETDFFLSSGTPEVEMVSNAFTPYLKYRALFDGKEKVKKFSLPKTEASSDPLSIDWTSNENGFFGLVLNPIKASPGFKAKQIPGQDIPTRLTLIDSEYNRYPAKSYPGYQMRIALPKAKEINLRFFSGPYQDSLLKKIDTAYIDPTTGDNPSYISVKKPFGFFTFISDPFAQLLLIIMKLFYFVTRSWGFSIILLTIAFRIMLYPLNAWSIRSTTRMNEVAPMTKIIQAKYKKDPKKAQMELLKLYKEKKANPVSGCLPMLIQMPFLVGMFDLLKSTFELRGVPFIPGWIDSLTSPDVLVSWSYPIYFIGTELHLLPILLGVVMFVQSHMNVKVPKGAVLTDQQKQAKSMSWMMTILFTFLFYNAASGLNIYFLCSMFLGIIQQWFMNKQKNKA